MFLSGAWIEENGDKLVTPFFKEQIDCSAYTMRIGSEVYVSPESKAGREATLTQLIHEQEISIPPGQFAFLISKETITLPIDLMALINLRTKLKSQGLINVSGFHVDPGYSGKLVFSVFNAGQKTIKLRADDPALLIWFARLEMPDARYSKKKAGFAKIDSDLIALLPPEGVSIGSLSARLSSVEATFQTFKWIGGIAFAIFVAVLGSFPFWG